MPNKKAPPSAIPTRKTSYRSEGSFVRLDDKNVVQVTSSSLQSYDGSVSRPLQSAQAQRDLHKNYDTNTSVRVGFTRDDYEFFRPNESIPHDAQDIIAMCRGAYRRVGIIRNVIDLMSDFGCQGARLVHPNPAVQKFYRGWWNKVRGDHVSERFLNLLYREGVSVAKRTMGKLPVNETRRISSMAENLEPDTDYIKTLETSARNIPLRYNFLNPLSLKVVGEELACFVGKQIFALKVSYTLRQAVNHPKTTAERDLINMLPKDILSAIQRGDQIIPLDPNKVRAFFYKKDDWQSWADPMTYAIMDDIFLLEKMKLADLAALDGAISQIRLWKLGNLNESHPEASIFPTATAIDRLSDILLSNPGGGAFDLIWGPELSVEEYKTNVHQFLGEEKYKPIWNSIYAGLGVPPTLTGASTASGFTNNYISLQTLIQRLEYGRAALREFWKAEIELVRQAMGFSYGARLMFDNMALSDEASAKALLIQLIDRDVLSVETVTERFGEDPEFEQLRLKKETEAREKKTMNPKASPWHTPEKMYEFMKIALQRGYIAPEQTGMNDEIPEEFLDVEVPFDKQVKSKETPPSSSNFPDQKKSGPVGSGKPLGATDKGGRDQRTPKPIGASSAAYFTTFVWAKEAQQKISDIVTPAILKKFEKKSLRALSHEQATQAEAVKFAVLAATTPFSEINETVVRGVLSKGQGLPAHFTKLYNALHANVLSSKKGDVTVDDIRTIQVAVYAMMNCDAIYEE